MTGAPAAGETDVLVEIKDLTVEFPSRAGWLPVVDKVSFSLEKSQTFGLVGESGSGKTVTSLAISGLVGAVGGRMSGSVLFEETDLATLGERELSHIRGARIGMIFQQPVRSLDPAFTVGEQISETIRRHEGISRQAAWARAVDGLDRVGIANAARRAKEYPHTFSGGMCQRVMIAVALACSPSLLIADEPTTALDVTVQARILDLLRSIQEETKIAILFVSHDLGLIAEMCDVVAVMYAGQIVEYAPIDDIFSRPFHPYTEGLLGAVPKVGLGRRLKSIEGGVPSAGSYPNGCRYHPRCPYSQAGRCDTEAPALEGDPVHPARCLRQHELVLPGVLGVTLLEVEHLSKRFASKHSLYGKVTAWHHAVDDVSFTLERGETLALVGESGAGKSTTARLVLRLIEPDTGSIVFDGTDLRQLGREDLRLARRRMQMIFQDPFSSLDPHLPVGESVAEPLRLHSDLAGPEQRRRISELMERVGLNTTIIERYPSELSGGQLQRVAIARALTVQPDLIVCDEPVAALDVSVRAQVLNLMGDLQEELGVAYLFISHDLALVQIIADRVAVMSDGHIVECGPVDSLYNHPSTDYTRELLRAIPTPIPPHLRAAAAASTLGAVGPEAPEAGFAPPTLVETPAGPDRSDDV